MPHKILFFLFFLSFLNAAAQDSMPATPVVCYAAEGTTLSQILPEISTQNNRNTAATLSFAITYDSNFPAEGKAAVQKAADIWASYLVSPVPIHLNVTWQALEGTTLAKSGATQILRNFVGAPYQNVWYSQPLAEALAGKDLNNGQDDITINLSSKYNWNYAIDGKPIAGKFDLVSVVLHEFGHCLGFAGTFMLNKSNTTQLQWGQLSSATIFDVFLQDSKSVLLTNTAIYGNPSASLLTAMTSNALYFGLKNAKFKNNLPKLYAPNPYVEGTSISHFDETTYPSGSANSLMSPKVQAGEVVQAPGELLLNAFFEMGWYVKNLNVTVTGTESILPQVFETKIFPNPSSDLLYVAVPNNGKTRQVSIELMNQQGRVLRTLSEENILSKTIEMSINELPAGLYFVRISDEFQVVTKKFIKY
jgi:Secretion system C-terminal sorting domain